MKAAVLERSAVGEKFYTLSGFVAIRRRAQDIEEETAGGILKPQTAQEKPQWAEIVAVSKDETEFEIGDEVFISKYTPADIEPFPGEKCTVIHRTLVYLYPKRHAN